MRKQLRTITGVTGHGQGAPKARRFFRSIRWISLLVVAAACDSGSSPPSAPTEVVATPLAGAIEVTWKHDGEGVRQFAIHRSDGDASAPSEGDEVARVGADRRSWLDEGVESGASYRYLVAALGDGETSSSLRSDASGDAGVSPLPESDAPTLSDVSVDPDSLGAAGGTVALSWSATNAEGVSVASEPGLPGLPVEDAASPLELDVPHNTDGAPITYRITLTARGEGGDVATDTAQLEVEGVSDPDPKPELEASPQLPLGALGPFPVTFDGSGSTTVAPTAAMEVVPGEGLPAVELSEASWSATYAYDEAGVYEATLRVWDVEDRLSETAITVEVGAEPFTWSWGQRHQLLDGRNAVPVTGARQFWRTEDGHVRMAYAGSSESRTPALRHGKMTLSGDEATLELHQREQVFGDGARGRSIRAVDPGLDGVYVLGLDDATLPAWRLAFYSELSDTEGPEWNVVAPGDIDPWSTDLTPMDVTALDGERFAVSGHSHLPCQDEELNQDCYTGRVDAWLRDVGVAWSTPVRPDLALVPDELNVDRIQLRLSEAGPDGTLFVVGTRDHTTYETRWERSSIARSPVVAALGSDGGIIWQEALAPLTTWSIEEGTLPIGAMVHAKQIAVSADTVYVAMFRGPGPSDPSNARSVALIALDAANGEELWRHEYGRNSGGYVDAMSLAALDDGSTVAAYRTNTSVFGLTAGFILRKTAPDGAIVWTRRYPTPTGGPNEEAFDKIVSVEGIIEDDAGRLLMMAILPCSEAYPVDAAGFCGGTASYHPVSWRLTADGRLAE